MDKPTSLDSLFKEKIFRIPDYQRGYAWQPEQLKAFWEDLVNLSDSRYHYTGVLTLKNIPSEDVSPDSHEYWLVEDHSYEIYQIVDGQQRLTTFVVLLQAFVEYVRKLPENEGKDDSEIYISDSLSVAAVQERFLFKIKPTGDQFRTYKFGYTEDNPSYDYLRYCVLGESGSGSVQETFYTLNLSNAKRYFAEQFEGIYTESGFEGLQDIYKKLTRRFLFNEYVIEDEFDVFVMFETMNNRGKRLSDLELLKNRLIYLTTLYPDEELDAASKKNLRQTINDAWKEVYKQLGRNKSRSLNDDDFLQAHWTLYYKYSRKTGQDYIKFLLDQQFSPQRVHKKVERLVALETIVEQRTELDFEVSEIDSEEEETVAVEESSVTVQADLSPVEIRDYVHSLKECAVHWFNSHFPQLADGMSDEERRWIEALNRIRIAYFRPLVMSILKNEPDEAARLRVFKRIERFIFIAFRMNAVRSNYRSSEFYRAAMELDRGQVDVDTIADRLDSRLSYSFNEDGTFWANDFYNVLFKKFDNEVGYYGWAGLRYFLYEYELSLLSASRQKKVGWEDLQKSKKDTISVEHIYPQTPKEGWAQAFSEIPKESRRAYNGSLGNLVLLSMSINSSLQNDSFEDKKQPRFASGRKTRNGYSDGSHSEIEVSQNDDWGPEQIRERGIRLLRFMEERWDIRLKDGEREPLLFLASDESVD
tara:strand:+ start:19354 stop:21456 length:2103 start_codon:yes stop_codon:yes gene_type:complete